jgi:RNA polymerase sigma-70 factor (ECF subfamily)
VIAEPTSRQQWGQLRSDVSRLVARRLTSRADVEDVVQEVLIRVWKHGADVRDEERFGAWLSRVAHSAVADHVRARQRLPLARYESREPSEGPWATGATAGEQEEPETRALIAAVLRPFIAAMPSPYRETLAMSELDGLTHAAIAEKIGLSVSAVKSRVQRGREHLRRMLERCCEIGLDARGAPVTCEVRPDGVLPEGCCCDQSAATGSSCQAAAPRAVDDGVVAGGCRS